MKRFCNNLHHVLLRLNDWKDTYLEAKYPKFYTRYPKSAKCTYA